MDWVVPSKLEKLVFDKGGQDVVSQFDYDSAGRLKREYLPGFGAPSSAFTEYVYEDSPLGRLISISRPAPLGVETIGYAKEGPFYTETHTNTLSEFVKIFSDTRGRKIKNISGKVGLTNTTNYQYDNKNNLLKVLPDGRTASDIDYIYDYKYDGCNRLVSKKMPEKTLIEMNYDLRDQLTHYRDGIHPVVYSDYDEYGRMTKTATVASLGSVAMINLLSETEYKTQGLGFGQPYKNKWALFGANGQPNGNFIKTETTGFDVFHRPISFTSNHILSLSNAAATSNSLLLNARDQITQQTESVNVNGVNYTLLQNLYYDNAGRSNKTEVSWAGVTKTVEEITGYDALDKPLQVKIGGNLQTVDYEYFPGGSLDKMNGGITGAGGLSVTSNQWPSENSSKDLFAMDLDYLPNGNISNWNQQNRGFVQQNFAYTYDAHQRISTASNGIQSQEFSYKDALGNFNTSLRRDLVKNTGVWGLQTIDDLSYTYENALSSKIKSVKDATNSSLGYKANSGVYSYDGNGNTIYDPANKIRTVYNYLNLPSKFTKDDGGRQELMYDFSGKKWQENEYNQGGNLFLKRSYIGSFEFEDNSLQRVFHSVGFIQQPTLSSGAANKTAGWNYILRDHLNNTRILFSDKNNDGLIKQDASAVLNEVLSVSNYSPFGIELGGSHQNQQQPFDYKFNGKQENAFSGLTDFGGRWLDKNLQVWRQVDPMGENLHNLSLSTYCFSANNPINNIDPDGRDWYTNNETGNYTWYKGKEEREG
jgi:RHS repeat-associated protein